MDIAMNAQELREAALSKLKQRKGLQRQLKTYVIANLTLVVIWALSGRGDFWPIWPIIFWGLALIYQAWAFSYPDKPISEEDIDNEIKRMGS